MTFKDDFNFLTDEEKKTVKAELYQRLNLPYKEERSFLRPVKSRRWIGIAATLVISCLLLLFYQSINSPINKALFVVQTGANEIKKIILGDSSVVILNPHSSLRYSKPDPRGSREVYLEGNAFFKVKREASLRPFIVHAQSLSVTVLGTEFNVNARSKAIEVSLTKGKVQVNREGAQQHAEYMLPGDKLKLDTLSYLFNKTRMSESLYSPWTSGQWNFQQTTLEDIAGLIDEYYGVNIVFKNERAKYLRMTAVIPVVSLGNLLPVIAQTLHVSVKELNNQVLIQ